MPPAKAEAEPVVNGGDRLCGTCLDKSADVSAKPCLGCWGIPGKPNWRPKEPVAEDRRCATCARENDVWEAVVCMACYGDESWPNFRAKEPEKGCGTCGRLEAVAAKCIYYPQGVPLPRATCSGWRPKDKPTESWHGFKKGERIKSAFYLGTVCGGDTRRLYMIRDDGYGGGGPNGEWLVDPVDAKRI